MVTRLEKASRVYQKWRRQVFWSRSVSKRTKLHVFQVMVMPVLLYGAETWAVTQQENEVPARDCWDDAMGQEEKC